MTRLISHSATRVQREPGAEQRADRDARGQPAGDRRGEERDERERQEAEPGLQRREAEDVLQVERQVEEHREHRRRDRERRRSARRRTPGARRAPGRPSSSRSRACDATKSAEQRRRRRRAAPTISALVQPWLLPSISARIRQSRPPVSVTSPSGSSRPCSGSLDSCSSAARAATAPMPIGMLTKKIQRHESHEVSIPPASGPTATAAPIVAPQMPERGAALLAVELLRDQRQRRREHDRAADPLHAARDDQEERVVRERRRPPRRS